MRFYSLYCRDVKTENWIFSRDDGHRVTLHPIYRDLQCGKCKKIDEVKALERGLIECQIEEMKADYFRSNDGMLCINERFKKLLDSAGIAGLKYYPAPNPTGKKYYVWIPTRQVSAKRSAFKFSRRCSECGRFKTVYGGPSTLDMELPDEPKVICVVDVPPETEGGIMLIPIAGEDVVKLLKQATLNGILALRIKP